MTMINERQIFSKNLNKLIQKSGKTQKEISTELKLGPSTFNSWATGAKMPRMNKIQMLADYFGVKKSDLVEESTQTNTTASNLKIEEDLKKQAKLYLFGDPEASDALIEKMKKFGKILYEEDKETREYLEKREEFLKKNAKPYAAADGNTENLEEAMEEIENLFIDKGGDFEDEKK